MVTAALVQKVKQPQYLREMRIDAVGRFGNYFFVHGWQTVSDLTIFSATYQLPGAEQTIIPEYTFAYPVEEPVQKYTKAPMSLCESARFLHLFWVNNGYKLEVSQASPITVSFARSSEEQAVHAHVQTIREKDVPYFLAALEAAGGPDIWTNRFILEIVAGLAPKEQFLFHLKAATICGWKRAETAFLETLRNESPTGVASPATAFYSAAVLSTPTAYLSSDLVGRLEHYSGALSHEAPADVMMEAVCALHKVDPAKGFRFAQQRLSSVGWDRKEVAARLTDFFPSNAKWWLKSVLENDHLGNEQAAEALNLAGTAAHSQNQNDLASLCFALAVKVDPQAQSAAWNLGITAVQNGDVEDAGTAFAAVQRHYPNQSLSTQWPSVQGIAWPHHPFPTSGFRLPEGTADWPRISIITPSFNQARFIEETLLSVLNQQYPNLQYIVIDGASTDGTIDILERYRHRLDHLIIEPDGGQTEAINKGLRLADGKMIAWLNSDDLFGPGALHRMALAWLESGADLLAGICTEHADRRILLVNKPAARNADFNPPQLARIFRYWLKGYYFYQPEVFFTKRILDQVGLLDESLYYAMDYDLWMRFSKAGARLNVVDWPVAFFRKHEAQKTFDLVDTVEEQARVRSRHLILQPDEQRLAQIGRTIAQLRAKKPLRVGVLTKRIGKIFSKNMQEELDLFCGPDHLCHLASSEHDPRIADADIVIMLVHVLNDLEAIRALRTADPDRPIVGWFWDNHHHLFENQAVAEQLDIVIPGHALYAEYLRSDHALQAQPVPLCVTQWTRQDAAGWFDEFGSQERSPDLYGGFVDYAFEPKRMEFLKSAMETIPGHALTILSEANLAEYFGRSEKERFEEWCRYQTSLVLPLRNDLSQRVFDALLAGQIPLVPEEIKDLDLVIPRKLQDSLPIIRFKMSDPASLVRAQRAALESFATGGHDAVRTRQLYALENHCFSARISSILCSFTVV